jgi:hypothetical protein
MTGSMNRLTSTIDVAGRIFSKNLIGISRANLFPVANVFHIYPRPDHFVQA